MQRLGRRRVQYQSKKDYTDDSSMSFDYHQSHMVQDSDRGQQSGKPYIRNGPESGSFGYGHGHGGHKKDNDNCMGLSVDICPDLLLAGLALAGAAAFVALFTAITMAGRRKKRSVGELMARPLEDDLKDIFWLGRQDLLLCCLTFVKSMF